MIGHVIWRIVVVAVAFCIAALVALAVLFGLGALWVGEELRAAAPPDDPFFAHEGATVFGIVLFTTAVAPALTALPALLAAIAGEVLRLRSWLYYVLAGGASVVAIPLLAGAAAGGAFETPHGAYMTIFATAGFAGGFIYWLLAGARA